MEYSQFPAQVKGFSDSDALGERNGREEKWRKGSLTSPEVTLLGKPVGTCHHIHSAYSSCPERELV